MKILFNLLILILLSLLNTQADDMVTKAVARSITGGPCTYAKIDGTIHIKLKSGSLKAYFKANFSDDIEGKSLYHHYSFDKHSGSNDESVGKQLPARLKTITSGSCTPSSFYATSQVDVSDIYNWVIRENEYKSDDLLLKKTTIVAKNFQRLQEESKPFRLIIGVPYLRDQANTEQSLMTKKISSILQKHNITKEELELRYTGPLKKGLFVFRVSKIKPKDSHNIYEME